MIEFPSSSWHDYELLDSGAGEKLERFGAYVLARPEPKALWDKSLPQAEWDRLAHTRFKPGAGFGKAGKEDSGTWDRLHRMDDQWWIRYPIGGGSSAEGAASTDFASLIPPTPEGAGPSHSRGHGRPRPVEAAPSAELSLRLGLTSFKHVGVFPEQAPNWEFIYRKCRQMQHPRVLNLFAYTGAASLAARAGGAEVTHLDSVRQVVTWARGNMERTGLENIRWVVEDAMKFARREARRGNTYDGIILDPPAYGHGPDGEKWKLDECLFEMLRTVAQILAPHGFVVLNLYSNGYSAALGETLVREAFGIPAAVAASEGGVPSNFASLIPPTADAAGPSHSRGHGRPRFAETPPSSTFAAGNITSGELALRDKFGKVLPLSIVVRLEKL